MVSAEKMFYQKERQRNSLHPWLRGQAEPQGLSGGAPALGAWRLRVLLCWEEGDAVQGVSGYGLHGGSTDDYDGLRNADVHGAGRQDARGYPAVEPVWLPRPAQGRVRQEAGGLLHLRQRHVASTGAPVEVRRRCRPPSALDGALCGYRFYRRVCRPVPPLGPDPGGQTPDRSAVGAPSLSI